VCTLAEWSDRSVKQVVGLACTVAGLAFLAGGGASLADGTGVTAQFTMAVSDGIFLIALGMIFMTKWEDLPTLISQLSCVSWSVGGYFNWHRHPWAPVLLVYAAACTVVFIFTAISSKDTGKTEVKGPDSPTTK
jgi:drug/metabolite transporter (DMT)-like permease